ncbi:X-box-binding protein 1 isoform X1 [Octopus bimaculoides]|uniref:X-box-binding protein 1 n=1 Tax=Octopus bimaculoides TaxID=37653 RepID=A0A0L8FWK4_OCTBM|nr:X-box-binding protein 1 isoform X1 [Octopus bimaculoides]|eukprot:XP_014786214.1 PREDICTED: X-box-binding protein 1-like isoform X1 [Octopus bimaculoides]
MTAIAEFQKPDTLIITTNGGRSTVRRAAIVATSATNGVAQHRPATSVITVKPIVKTAPNVCKIQSNVTGLFTTSLLSPKQQQTQQQQVQSQTRLQQQTEKNIVLGSHSENMNVFRLTSTAVADDEDASSIGSDGAPRKRRRLTHLSPEEKIQRRKLKNRVAAQTARDRKKAQMSDMEIAIDKLQNENKKLLQQNLMLQKKTDTLVCENAELRERLGQLENGECNHLSTTTTTTTSSGTTSTSSPLSSSSSSSLSSSTCNYNNNNSIANSSLCKSESLSSPVKTESKCLRSAVPIVSLPQKHILMLFHLMIRCSFLAVMMNLANGGNFWMKSAIQNLKTQSLHSQLQILRVLELLSFSQKRIPIPWWGPQQHNWTPSMNL